MDMEATGYENILLRGLFLGVSPREAREMMDEVAEFTELGEYLAMPLCGERDALLGERKGLRRKRHSKPSPGVLVLAPRFMRFAIVLATRAFDATALIKAFI